MEGPPTISSHILSSKSLSDSLKEKTFESVDFCRQMFAKLGKVQPNFNISISFGGKIQLFSALLLELEQHLCYSTHEKFFKMFQSFAHPDFLQIRMVFGTNRSYSILS